MKIDTPRPVEVRLADRRRFDIPLFANRYASVLSVQPDTALPETPVYALNWFNTRSLTLYNWYNRLAEKPLRAAAGSAFFKARLAVELYGNSALQRDILLIVRYPSISAFGSLLRSRYFQLLSVLRVLAVRDFTFAFSSRRDQPDVAAGSGAACPQQAESYLVHVHRGADTAGEIDRLVQADNALSMIFSGQVCAHLATGSAAARGRDSEHRIPCVMEHLMVLGAPDRAQLNAFVATQAYRQIIESNDCYAAIYDRLL